MNAQNFDDGYIPQDLLYSEIFRKFSHESKILFSFILSNASNSKVIFETAQLINTYAPTKLDKVKRELERVKAAEKQ